MEESQTQSLQQGVIGNHTVKGVVRGWGWDIPIDISMLPFIISVSWVSLTWVKGKLKLGKG